SLVATAKQDYAIDGICADGFLHVHTRQIAEEHRRRLHQRFAKRHDRKFHRKSSCFEYPAFHRLRKVAKMCVARGQFGPGIAYTDHGLAVKHIGRNSLVFHPSTVYKTVFTLPSKPVLASQFLHSLVGYRLAIILHCRRHVACNSPPRLGYDYPWP